MDVSIDLEEEAKKSRTKAERAQMKRTKLEVKLDFTKIKVNCLIIKLLESESQVIALKKRINQSNKHQRFTTKVLEVSNRKKRG